MLDDNSGGDSAARGTVHIVDDDPMVGRTLASLARSAGIEARSHVSAEAFLRSFDPETTGCVVTDARMPGMSGVELQRAVKARDAATAVIIITGHAAASLAVEALKGGAADFIEKPVKSEDFLSAVRDAVAATRRSAQDIRAYEAVADRAAQLSQREREVMDLVVAGHSSPVIAGELGISVRTVESHRARVMEKMGAGGLADLVRMGLRLAR
jgi:two-component system response regulator FixJ